MTKPAADPATPTQDSADTIVLPFIYVPACAPPPADWLRTHPDAIRLDAVFVPDPATPGARALSLDHIVEAALRSTLTDAAPGRPATPTPGDHPSQGPFVPGFRIAQGESSDAARAAQWKREQERTGMLNPLTGAPVGLAESAVAARARAENRPGPLVAVIFIGGFYEEQNTGIASVEGEARGFAREQGARGVLTAYFYWNQKEAIESFIRSLPADTRIRIVGHSYGGDTAAGIVERSNRKIELLVTVDPVSGRKPTFSEVRAHTERWININADYEHLNEPKSGPDEITDIGGHWDEYPKQFLDTDHLSVKEHHENFYRLLRSQLGRSTVRRIVAAP